MSNILLPQANFGIIKQKECLRSGTTTTTAVYKTASEQECNMAAVNASGRVGTAVSTTAQSH
jgi:hypothetical protein